MTDAAKPTLSEQAETLQYPMSRAAGCPLDPPPALDALQRTDRLVRVRLANGRTPWLVTRYEDQRWLLADSRLSSDPGNPGYPTPVSAEEPPDEPADEPPDGPTDGPQSDERNSDEQKSSSLSFILMDDPEHARLRRMVTGAFTVKRIERMRPRVQEIVDGFVDELLAGPRPADLVESLALPVPSLVICELLGVPYDDHAFFQENSQVIIRRTSTTRERSGALRSLGGYLHELVGRKMTSPAEDLLSDLAERVHAGELSRQEAVEIGMLLLIAGHETTANMIALGTFALLEHPDQLARLRDGDERLVSSAVEELLRYLHIVHNGRRRVAVDDIHLAGRTIRAGEGVILPNEIGNRDPEAFTDPDVLDLSRNPRRHLAFGFGVHQCLGQTLARLELQVVYGTLYRRIPTLRLATDVEQVPFKHDGTVYGVYELPVIW